MNAKQFLERLWALSDDAKGPFSATVMKLPKLAAAEAIAVMLNDSDFGVRINAIKAIRKFELDLFEKELIKLLIDPEDEVRVAAVRTLCSFGKTEHFRLVRAFYDEYAALRPLIIDSFVNFSDTYEAHAFIFSQLDSTNEKIRESALEWFEKAFDHDIFLPWIATLYDEAPFTLRRVFEESFAHRLKLLFSDPKHGYRFKLIWLAKRRAA
ncbi:MAG: HEAT repeat domain-containing protein [Campylobacterales bacterium]